MAGHSPALTKAVWLLLGSVLTFSQETLGEPMVQMKRRNPFFSFLTPSLLPPDPSPSFFHQMVFSVHSGSFAPGRALTALGTPVPSPNTSFSLGLPSVTHWEVKPGESPGLSVPFGFISALSDVCSQLFRDSLQHLPSHGCQRLMAFPMGSEALLRPL